jgi:hypothetical protein
MKKMLCIAAFAGATVFAGSFFPTIAVIANEKGNEKKIDAKANGFVAFAASKAPDESASIDLERISDEETFRIVLNPSFENSISFSLGPFVVAEKRMDRDVLSKTLAVEQLPPGRYVTRHFYLGKKGGGSAMRKDTLEIEAGKIVSLGILEISAERNFLQIVKTFRIETKGTIPDSTFIPFGRLGIPTTPSVSRSVKWEPK